MTQLFHRFRTRSRALAHGLLLVLVATWLSAVCPHCLAQAEAAPAMSAHCQHEAPPPADSALDGHDGCPQSTAPVCAGGECAQMSAVVSIEPVAAVATDMPVHLIAPGAPFSHVYPTSPPVVPVIDAVVLDPCPLYLRHCVFRN
ncbi:MAG: hypothetical protein HY941_12590 [Gammaproteobacteria bacterium]|nr:hypothetical protein [Gammaproteobacteria bacterium]